MKIYRNSITTRLFLSFGILVFNIVVVTFLALFFLSRTTIINEITHRVDNQRISVINLLKTDLDFLRFETVNIQYFQTGESKYIKERENLLKTIRKENISLHHEMVSNYFLIEYQFQRIDSTLDHYSSTFQLLTRKINERGFKDFGLEGTMRNFAHELENRGSGIALSDLLTLRRHEKDFLLRKEQPYIDKFNELADYLIGVLQQEGLNVSEDILIKYKNSFNALAKLNFEIGVTPTSGLLQELNNQTETISTELQQMIDLTNARKEEMIKESAIIFSSLSIALIVLSLALTYFTSTRLARPIKKLSQSMGKFIVNEGLNEQEMENWSATDEISNLSASFIKLARKLKTQFHEIVQQNNELKKLNAELDRFIYSAAHDLKSPLASLDGLVKLAEKEINSVSHVHYFHMMSSTVKKLDGFIRDITDYAKNKRQQIRIEKIDLNSMVRDIIESLQFLPNANKMEVVVNIIGQDFYTDKTRLEIILKNLLSNSFRYMDFVKSNPFIRIEGVINENNLRVKLSDNGIGIQQLHLHKIFDMFYRAVEHSQGTGIGLFLVKESVKMLRGRISVKSSLGEWTIFYLIIPNFKHGNVNIPESELVILEPNAME